MRPKLFLHIGTHKTGSTAIQQALASTSDDLLREKIVYLTIPFEHASALMNAEAVDEDIINKVRGVLVGGAKGCPDDFSFVLSFEGFAGSILKGYKNVACIAESLSRITEGFDVTVAVYLRRQDEFLESAYTQMIHEGESWDMPTFLKHFDQDSFNWFQLLNSYAKAFSKDSIKVVPYCRSRLTGKSGLIDSFANIVGSSVLRNYETELSPNAGFSRDAIEIARLCNPSLDQRNRKLLRAILQRTNTKEPFESYNYLTADERRRIVETYSESNAAVAEKYLENAGAGLFPESPVHDSTEDIYPGLTQANIGVVLNNIILTLQDQENAGKHRSKPASAFVWAERKLAGIIGKNPRLKLLLKRII